MERVSESLSVVIPVWNEEGMIGELVTEIDGEAPGRALDVGCGVGNDAIWLASHGWNVTAIVMSRSRS